jgi:dGTP triphosphohydrolase
MRIRLPLLLPLLLALSIGTGCRSAYYSTMEAFGKEKRDLLVDEVEAGRADQAEAQEQFRSTYELFQHLTGYEGGELEDLYDDLADELEDCEDAADDVRGRIDDIEQVARDLFLEWSDEIEAMSSDSLREKSTDMRAETRERYQKLIAAMRAAEERMDPVLVAFRDHVLFLKHNLNARAIAALSDVVLEIEGDVDALIADMDRAIREADEFLRSMEG